MAYPQKAKRPAYYKEVDKITKLLGDGQERTFTQVLQAMNPELYRKINQERARTNAALRKLLLGGEIQKNEIKKDAKVLYSLR